MWFCTKLRLEILFLMFYSIDLERDALPSAALPCKSRWTGTEQHWAGAVFLKKIWNLKTVWLGIEHRQSYWRGTVTGVFGVDWNLYFNKLESFIYLFIYSSLTTYWSSQFETEDTKSKPLHSRVLACLSSNRKNTKNQHISVNYFNFC